MHSFNIDEKGNPLHSATNALILVHGRGANTHDILSLADSFTNENWYIAAPQAANNTWYPYSFMVPAERNEPWLSSAIDILYKLFRKILDNLPSDNIYIMGFSQGACLITEFTARYARKYGGIIAFTGGLIGGELNYENYRGDFEGTNVYLSNSDNDPYIPKSRSLETELQMKKMGAKVTLDIFPGRPHTIIEQEIDRAKGLVFREVN